MQQWVNSYRSLLDSWRLWTQRAKFDVEFYKGHSSRSEKLPQQVLILSILHSPYSLHLIDLIKRSIFVLYIILFVAIKVKVKEILQGCYCFRTTTTILYYVIWQVYVSCNYCGKSITVFVGNKGKMPLNRPNPNIKSKVYLLESDPLLISKYHTTIIKDRIF